MKKNEGGYLIPSVIKSPKNKWQAFKAKHFPLWLQNIFPIKEETVDFKKEFLHLMKEPKGDKEGG